MASSALKKITTRAKHIRRIHGGTWKTAIKKAGAEYRAGKIHGVKKRIAGKKKSRKKIVRRVKALHAAEGKAIRRLGGVRSTFQAAAIGGLTTAQHLAHAKKKIVHDIATAEAHKFTAKTKTAKRKISKRVTALKSKYRKLC
jgi:hypothetical protein